MIFRKRPIWEAGLYSGHYPLTREPFIRLDVMLRRMIRRSVVTKRNNHQMVKFTCLRADSSCWCRYRFGCIPCYLSAAKRIIAGVRLRCGERFKATSKLVQHSSRPMLHLQQASAPTHLSGRMVFCHTSTRHRNSCPKNIIIIDQHIDEISAEALRLPGFRLPLVILLNCYLSLTY